MNLSWDMPKPYTLPCALSSGDCPRDPRHPRVPTHPGILEILGFLGMLG